MRIQLAPLVVIFGFSILQLIFDNAFSGIDSQCAAKRPYVVLFRIYRQIEEWNYRPLAFVSRWFHMP